MDKPIARISSGRTGLCLTKVGTRYPVRGSVVLGLLWWSCLGTHSINWKRERRRRTEENVRAWRAISCLMICRQQRWKLGTLELYGGEKYIYNSPTTVHMASLTSCSNHPPCTHPPIPSSLQRYQTSRQAARWRTVVGQARRFLFSPFPPPPGFCQG